MKDSFTVGQKLGLKEYIIVIYYSIFSSSKLKAFFLIVFGLSILNAIFKMVIVPDNYSSSASLINNMGPIVGLFVLMNVLVLLLCYIVYKNKPHLFTNVSYDFTHWGIVRHGKETDFAKPWREITKYRETTDFFLFNVGTTDFHCIQKKMFADDAEVTDFRNFLKDKMRRYF